MATAHEQEFAFHEARRDSDHSSFLAYHRLRWLKLSLLLCLAAILGYVFSGVKHPNGGSWYGYTLGTIGALMIVWLSLLGVRKRKMTDGRWSLKAWTSAHVYLGLSLIVIATLHTGFQFGWNVHTLAYVLMLLVIFSGFYGIAVYAMLPTALSNNRGTMTQAQMLEALAALDRQLDKAAQPLARGEADVVIGALGQDPFDVGLGARLTGRVRDCATAAALHQLSHGHPGEAEARVISLLRKRQAQLDQIRRHMKIRAQLEIWLFIHVPLTVALLAALAAHIISVFYYW